MSLTIEEKKRGNPNFIKKGQSNMNFTELTVQEYESFVQNPALESHYFQVKENIDTRESDGFDVVLLGVKDDNQQVIAASLSNQFYLDLREVASKKQLFVLPK